MIRTTKKAYIHQFKITYNICTLCIESALTTWINHYHHIQECQVNNDLMDLQKYTVGVPTMMASSSVFGGVSIYQPREQVVMKMFVIDNS